MGNLVSPCFKMIKVKTGLEMKLSGRALTSVCQALSSPLAHQNRGLSFTSSESDCVNVDGTESRASQKKSEMRLPT